MNKALVTSLYFHNHLISLVMLDRQRKPLMRTDVKRREIWEWRDHTRKEGVRDLVMELCCALHNFRVRLNPWQPMV
jgi:hypothetical protein